MAGRFLTMEKMRDMKYCFLLAVGAVLAVASGCDREENPGSEPDTRHSVTLQANAVGNETKNIFDAGGNFYWLPSDAIGLATVGGDGKTTFSELKWDSETAYVRSGSFSGEVEGKVGAYAVYPYNTNHKLSGTTLTYNLPSSYTYDSVDTDFYSAGSTSYINSSNAPAYGVIAGEGNNLSTEFKHLGGVLCIKIDKMSANKGYVTLTADRKIAGNFTVDLSAETPELTTSTETASEGNSITIDYWAVEGASGVFYFPLPVGEYNVTLTVGFQKVPTTTMYSCTTASRSLEISRRDVKKLSVTYATIAKTGYCCYNGYKFIDLDLPSGTLWAETNVGASGIYGIGRFYTWGETEIKSSYSEPDSYEKYNSTDKLTTLENDNDAAYVNWGSFCRMPSKEEFDELIKYCTWKSDGSNGMWFTSTLNGNSVFFPYTGYKYDDVNPSVGLGGFYWTREITADACNRAYGFRVYNTGTAETLWDQRWGGYAVRAVVEK